MKTQLVRMQDAMQRVPNKGKTVRALKKSAKKEVHARVATGIPVPSEDQKTVSTPAVVTRHRQSVRRLSLGARTSQLLVGVTLKPTQIDDEAYALPSAKSSQVSAKSISTSPLGEQSMHRCALQRKC